MIIIKNSKTADSRTCNVAKVSKEQLLRSSHQHRSDVIKGFKFFNDMMMKQAYQHDWDKLWDIDAFYADFKTSFDKKDWLERHIRTSRHHLLEKGGVPEDVNLIDVLDMIIDCVMAGKGRKGEVYPLEIDPEVLMLAFNNTAELLKKQVVVR